MSEFTSDQFEVVLAYLLEAEHDVKVECVYHGQFFKRQFDGLKSIELGPPFNPFRIGIECKNWSSNSVDIITIEAYFTKRLRCANVIDKLIVITKSKFTEGAILEARTGGIELFEFRQGTPEDMKGMVSGFELHIITPQPPFVEVNVHGEDETSLLSRSDKSTLIEPKKILSGSTEDQLFDEDGYFVGLFTDMLNEKVKRLFIEGIKERKSFTADLSDRKLYYKRRILGRTVPIRFLSYEVTLIPRPDLITTSTVGADQLDPSEWYVMTNALTGEWKLIDKTRIQQIIEQYELTQL